jgi:hypothetical protein
MNNPNIVGGSLPASMSALPVSPGGKLSNASQEARITRPTPAISSRISSWNQRPAGVVADEGDILHAEAASQLGHQPGDAGQR